MIELNVNELEHVVGGARGRGEGGCTRRDRPDRGRNGSRRDRGRDRSRGNRGDRSRREGGGRATER